MFGSSRSSPLPATPGEREEEQVLDYVYKVAFARGRLQCTRQQVANSVRCGPVDVATSLDFPDAWPEGDDCVVAWFGSNPAPVPAALFREPLLRQAAQRLKKRPAAAAAAPDDDDGEAPTPLPRDTQEDVPQTDAEDKEEDHVEGETNGDGEAIATGDEGEPAIAAASATGRPALRSDRGFSLSPALEAPHRTGSGRRPAQRRRRLGRRRPGRRAGRRATSRRRSRRTPGRRSRRPATGRGRSRRRASRRPMSRRTPQARRRR
jgi:hypothetical protein